MVLGEAGVLVDLTELAAVGVAPSYTGSSRTTRGCVSGGVEAVEVIGDVNSSLSGLKKRQYQPRRRKKK